MKTKTLKKTERSKHKNREQDRIAVESVRSKLTVELSTVRITVRNFGLWKDCFAPLQFPRAVRNESALI